MAANPFRALPSVAGLVSDLELHARGIVSEPVLTRLCQAEIETARDRIRLGEAVDGETIAVGVRDTLSRLARPRLQPVINATGVVIHTNLGRAPVSAETAAAMASVASSYAPLELNPASNERGGRMAEISELMRLLTGAEATLVVNNNAAAILLTLSALAAGREAIVSRGEAVEIGGGFRIPDVMLQSGAALVEVGTTNRTYASDYARALTGRTGLLLKVHTSNFAITGFTASAPIEQLAEIAASAGLPLVEDLGSGALLETREFGLADEPTIGRRIAAGVDIVTASGDKLLGGPQAGLIAGRSDLVGRIASHPLARAVRADKTCLAGAAATLRHYLRGDAVEHIPVWRIIAAQPEQLRQRALRLQTALAGAADIRASVDETVTTIGGGALPGQTLPGVAVALEPRSRDVDALARRLRTGEPRIFGHIIEDRLLLELRTVLPEDDDLLLRAVGDAIGEGGGRR